MTLVAILEEAPCPHTKISPRVWNVLRRALAKEPAERPRSAEALSLALVEALEDDAAPTFALRDVRASFEQSQSVVSIFPAPPEPAARAEDESERSPTAFGMGRPRWAWAALGGLGALLLIVAGPRFHRGGARLLAAAPEPFAIASAHEDDTPQRRPSLEGGPAAVTSSSTPPASMTPRTSEAPGAERAPAPSRGAAPRSHAPARSPSHSRDKSSAQGDVTHRPDF